jgi:hypothetical protein
VVLLIAAEPVWKNKPIINWTEEDAQQILWNSPWAKTVVAGITRKESEDERREGGNMGEPPGVGYDGIIDKKIPLTVQGVLFGTRSTSSDLSGDIHVQHFVGERYSTASAEQARRIYLLTGFGSTTIKTVPPEAYEFRASIR